MLTEAYIEALLVDEAAADLVWEAWEVEPPGFEFPFQRLTDEFREDSTECPTSKAGRGTIAICSSVNRLLRIVRPPIRGERWLDRQPTPKRESAWISRPEDSPIFCQLLRICDDLLDRSQMSRRNCNRRRRFDP